MDADIYITGSNSYLFIWWNGNFTIWQICWAKGLSIII